MFFIDMNWIIPLALGIFIGQETKFPRIKPMVEESYNKIKDYLNQQR